MDENKVKTMNGFEAEIDNPDDSGYTDTVTVAKFTDLREGLMFVIPGLWFRPGNDNSERVAGEADLLAMMAGLDLEWVRFPHNPVTQVVRFEHVRGGTISIPEIGFKADVVYLNSKPDSETDCGQEA